MSYKDTVLGGLNRPEKVRRESTPKSDDLLALDKNKARKEAALAEKHEFELAIRKGEYIPRSVLQDAGSTLLATLAQGLRSLPDALERKGVDPRTCRLVDAHVNEALNEVSKNLAMIGGGDD